MKLKYKGDHREYDPNLLVGPDIHGAFYRPVKATYNKRLNRTIITFRSWLGAERDPFDPVPVFPYANPVLAGHAKMLENARRLGI